MLKMPQMIMHQTPALLDRFQSRPKTNSQKAGSIQANTQTIALATEGSRVEARVP